jgi:membrane-bound serine protease (ClpP class)
MNSYYKFCIQVLSQTAVLLLVLINPIMAQDDTSNLQINKIIQIEIDSSINPATANYVKNALLYANKQQAQAILITMNTPGGLISTTKEILTSIGNSDIPIILWIGPEGASATSAGAIISSAAHFLFMAEGSNIGAATPVMTSGDIEDSDQRRKAINDLVALVEGLAQTRGREARFFADMIEKSSSFTSQEALTHRLIDGQSARIADIWPQINGKTIQIKGRSVTVSITAPEIIELAMDVGQHILNILAHPSLTYILILIGAALIYFELQAPGGFIAGSIGAICLGVAAIGMQLLPLSIGALGLIFLALILFILEAFITSYGLLAIAALISLTLGSLFLFRTDDSYIHFSYQVMFSGIMAVVVFLSFIFWFIIKDIKRSKKSAVFQFIGAQAKILTVQGKGHNQEYLYQVMIGGEIWRAVSNKSFREGDFVTITDLDNKTLTLSIDASQT